LTGYDEQVVSVSMPALLRAARQVYAAAVLQALAQAGCDDVPRNGSYVISATARRSTPLSEIIDQLGLSKQASGQLVDTLVARGYLDRSIDPNDRRRLVISLTERGHAAATIIRTAVDKIDADLTTRVGAAHVADTRSTLSALVTNTIDGPPGEQQTSSSAHLGDAGRLPS
jgi:DNA-binding MarR family transcriptional regulator